jgi:subtilisin family serine protease
VKTNRIIVILVVALTFSPIIQGTIDIAPSNHSRASYTVILVGVHNFTADEVSYLNRFGQVTTVAGKIAVLHTDTAYLSEVEMLPFVSQAQNSHLLRVQLDRSVPDVGANRVWDEIKDGEGRNVTGANVIVGFVDTGIDLTHPDFKFANGTTKIAYVWDQTTGGRPPDGFSYGYECSSVDIDSGLCPENDTFGHGTHVAGIAASTGLATGNYTGIAPGAKIIFVKSGQPLCNGASWTFQNAQILDGVSYIIKKSKQLGMRAVISLSLGGNIGGHDGSDPLEQALDSFVESGTPIVVAAGNEAGSNEHVVGQPVQASNVTVQVNVAQSTTDLQIDVWYPKQDEIDATLVDPNGTVYPVPNFLGNSHFASGIGNVTTRLTSSNVSDEAYMEVNSTQPLPQSGWHVSLGGRRIGSDGVWNAWVDGESCSYPAASFVPGPGYQIDEHDTLDIPGTALNVITVGAYTTKSTWKGIDGHSYGSSDIQVGQIASFSSLGPTRDERIKPDIVAPGMYIASARSDMLPVDSSDPDSFHRILAGTSMATPHVAGVIALMLQYAPGLQSSQIIQVLRGTARLDSFTGIFASGSPTWGFGKLDARTATGFYRLTLSAEALPGSAFVTVKIDNSSSVMLTGGSWSNYYFLKGASHSISLESTSSDTATRYLFANGTFRVSTNLLLPITYETQYLVKIRNPYDNTIEFEWIEANTTLQVPPPPNKPAFDLLNVLGGDYVWLGWIANNGTVIGENMSVTGPEALTALYVLTYSRDTLLEALIISVIFLIVILKKRQDAIPG